MSNQAVQAMAAQTAMAAMGMPSFAMGGMPTMPSLSASLDFSSHSSATGAAYGGGGMDNSGWAVNFAGTQGYDKPVSVGVAANQFALPATYSKPIGAVASVGAGGAPLLLVAGGVLLLLLALKKKA